MRFHKTNDISQNFSGITLGFCEVAKYFVDVWFLFRYFQKMAAKFWFHSNIFEILKFRTWRWQKLKKSMSQLPTWRQNDMSGKWLRCLPGGGRTSRQSCRRRSTTWARGWSPRRPSGRCYKPFFSGTDMAAKKLERLFIVSFFELVQHS
jgi:hypothetical protein